jgi:hypothetical protein
MLRATHLFYTASEIMKRLTTFNQPPSAVSKFLMLDFSFEKTTHLYKFYERSGSCKPFYPYSCDCSI